jgi:hypothetical protein
MGKGLQPSAHKNSDDVFQVELNVYSFPYMVSLYLTVLHSVMTQNIMTWMLTIMNAWKPACSEIDF